MEMKRSLFLERCDADTARKKSGVKNRSYLGLNFKHCSNEAERPDDSHYHKVGTAKAYN